MEDQWASKQFEQRLVEPNSVLGKAITYLQRHWEPLTLFLRQPGAPIDNNACERALKKAILHRKNSMFYKTRIGARLGDLFMSIFYTCQLNINPLQYMNTVCEHHAEVVDNQSSGSPGTTSRLSRRSTESAPPGYLVPHAVPQWRRDLRSFSALSPFIAPKGIFRTKSRTLAERTHFAYLMEWIRAVKG